MVTAVRPIARGRHLHHQREGTCGSGCAICTPAPWLFAKHCNQRAVQSYDIHEAGESCECTLQRFESEHQWLLPHARAKVANRSRSLPGSGRRGLHHWLGPRSKRQQRFVDIGGGSGLYGAYFHMRQAPKGSANLVFPMGPYGNLTIAPGGDSHFSAFKCGAGCAARGHGAITSWSTFDGTPGIEDLTRDLGPPGALVRNADLCDPALALPAHDWSMSLEVGEHLPSSCLANFMALLTNAGSLGLVLSWSQHSTGTCHINPRRASLLESALPYWGYVVDHEATLHCRHQAMLTWLRTGITVARKAEA